MGLKPDDFWQLTWREYFLMANGHKERQEIGWEHTRMIAGYIYNANVSKANQKKLEDFMPLSRDKRRKANKLSKAIENREKIKNGKSAA